jgi:hypothetical protein
MAAYPSVKHCRSCGEKKRLRWPKHNPTCCSKGCAAEKFLAYADVGLWEGAYCLDCGKGDPSCQCE